MKSITSRFGTIAFLTVLLLAFAASVKPLARRFRWFAKAANLEAVHIVAHLCIYGTLAFLARRAGLSNRAAVLLTLLIAAAQEGVQVFIARRLPGKPELFDLFVDSVAIAVVLGCVAYVRKAREGSAPSAESGAG